MSTEPPTPKPNFLSIDDARERWGEDVITGGSSSPSAYRPISDEGGRWVPVHSGGEWTGYQFVSETDEGQGA